MAGKFKRGRFLRALLAVSLTVVMVTGQFPLSAFADALQIGATEATSAQTENNATSVEGQEAATGAEQAPAEEQPAAGETEAPAEGQQPATEEGAADPSTADDAVEPADAKEGDKATAPEANQPATETAAAEPRSIQSITVERWVTNQQKGTFQLNQNMTGITADRGLTVEQIAAAGSSVNKHTFWKASLKGKDSRSGWWQDGKDYGPKQTTNTGDNQTASGTPVTSIRYNSNSGQLQFMINGNWEGVNGGRDSDLQLVFYYLQDMTVGDVVEFHASDWFNNSPDGKWGKLGYATAVEVKDVDSGEYLISSAPMYYNDDNPGVQSILVTELNRDKYEIVGVDKSQGDDNSGSWDYNQGSEIPKSGDPVASYTYEQMVKDGLGTKWNQKGQGAKNDPVHTVFTVKVRRTAQASLVKQLAGVGANQYVDSEFTFSATVTLPEGSDSTLRDSYPIDGTADGSTSVHMVVSADGKSGTVTGIKAKPSQKVTLKGLPYGAEVKFTETGVPTTDPSEFSTTYLNDVTKAADGTATAKHADGKSDNAPQTVTATNTVADGEGKLTVTKTFKGLNSLTAQERYDLEDSFQITSTENRIPALTLDNASVKGDITNESVTETTYTWTMSSLDEGEVTLTEQNYKVGGKGVTTESQVATDGTAFKPSVETRVTNQTKNVAFANEYGTTNKDVKIRKEWAAGITDDEKKPVTVQLNWTGKEGNKVTGSGTQGEYTLNADGNWETTVKNLPQHTGTYGDITYSIAETKVGEQTPEQAGFLATTSTDQTDGALVVTNSKATGVFELTKKVAGTAANEEEDFTFEITAQGANESLNTTLDCTIDGKPNTLTFNGGTATVTLKHDQTLSVSLPIGAYQVVETGVSDGTAVSAVVGTADSKVTSSNPKDGKFDATVDTNANVAANNTASVEVTNTTNLKPNLGISSNSLPMAGIGAAAVAGVIALAVSQRRRNAPLGSHARKE